MERNRIENDRNKSTFHTILFCFDNARSIHPVIGCRAEIHVSPIQRGLSCEHHSTGAYVIPLHLWQADGRIDNVVSFLARTKDSSSIPWGFVVQPLNPKVEFHVRCFRLSICLGYRYLSARVTALSEVLRVFESGLYVWFDHLAMSSLPISKQIQEGGSRWTLSLQYRAESSRWMRVLWYRYGRSAFSIIVFRLSGDPSSHEFPYESSARELLVLVVDCTSNTEYLESIKTILRNIVASYRDEVDIRTSFTPFLS